MHLGESNSVVVALVFHQVLRENQGRIANNTEGGIAPVSGF